MATLASPDGTARYAKRLSSEVSAEHFRSWPPVDSGPHLTLSSLGMGSYTGPADDSGDAEYTEAVVEAVLRGVNVLDCAINYRNMRSERAFGAGLAQLFEDETAARDEIFLMTKGGFLPFDGEPPADPKSYFRKAYLDTGLLDPEDIVGGIHSIAPRFLENQLDRSLINLGVDAVDVYFLHNLEHQLEEISRELFLTRVEAAFEFLEAAADADKIALYGVATWNGFRVPDSNKSHLELSELMAIAEKVGGAEHRFRVVQLPYNLGMLEALSQPTQTIQGQSVPYLVAAQAFGMITVTSVPLLQGQVLGHIPAAFAERMPGLETPAQRAIQFVRSTPGVVSPLVGMRSRLHVIENSQVAKCDPMSSADLQSLLQG